jgi:sugar O-acyltransferase (sialic acid O-acetyltransferase NeuD family)
MEIVILGAGRGSFELIDLLDGSELRAVSVLDDRWPDGPDNVAAVPVEGTLADASRHVSMGRKLLMGIANSRNRAIRYDIHQRLGIDDSAWAVFADPSASVSKSAGLGAGCIVYPGARIAAGVALGRQTVVYFNAVVHHDSILGDGVTVCAGVLVAGNVVVGEGSYLGIGSVIRDGVRVGKRVLVGMGAVVTQDVPDGATVAGVPARIVREKEIA